MNEWDKLQAENEDHQGEPMLDEERCEPADEEVQVMREVRWVLALVFVVWSLAIGVLLWHFLQ